jgi:hypothetical protein
MAEDNLTPAPDPAADAELGALGAQTSPNDTLGKGFTGSRGGRKKRGLLAKIPGSRKAKTWALAAGGGIIVAIIAAVISFLALIPLKIVHIVSNLESTFSATTENALDNESDNLLSQYYTRYVIPGLNGSVNPRCHSTLDAGCVADISGSGPVARLYQAWKQDRLENKLAQNYGLVFKKTGNQLYMDLDGSLIGQTSYTEFLSKGESIFDLASGAGAVSVTEARQAIDSALEDSSLWDKVYFRLKFGKLLEEKYGIKLCVIRCIIDDKFSYPLSNKIAAAKAEFALRVISPLSQSYGLEVACLLAGNCETQLQAADPTAEIPDELSGFQKQIQEIAQNILSEGGSDALGDVVAKTAQYSKNGFTKTMLSDIVNKVVSAFSGSDAGSEAAQEVIASPAAKTGEEAAGSAIPGVGWVILLAQVISAAGNAGNVYTALRYAIVAEAAVQLYSMYNTVASEIKSGHVDPTEVGSFTNALGTNLSGNSTDQLDATQTPLYQNLYGSTQGGGTPTSSTYKCNNGSSVPAGKLVCPEESLTANSGVLSGLSNTINTIPGLTGLASVISSIFNGAIGGLLSHIPVVSGLVGTISGAIIDIVKAIPGVSGLISLAEQSASKLIDGLIQSPFTNNMSGGRTFDMMAAGADVSYNQSCRVQLGCAQLTNQQVATIRNQQLNEEKTAFDSQSMFARIFSTTSPYSLVSQLAMALPTNVPTAINNTLASIVSDPLGKLGSVFSSIFASDKAFAAVPNQPDPFGVVQYGYTQVPTDPETYWDDYCQPQDPDQTDPSLVANQTEANWENGTDGYQAQQPDPSTGEPLVTTTDPCLLIESAVQSNGAMFDTSLAPPNSLTPDPASSSQGQ